MIVKFISKMNKKQKNVFVRIILSSILLICLSFLSLSSTMEFFLYLIPYYIIGQDILKKGWKGILKKQVFDENFLMMVATIGAFLLGEYVEGNAVMLFYQIGELFQSYAVGRSRESIIALMDIRPEVAYLLSEDGSIDCVDPYEIEVDDILVVKPGEKVAVDGILIKGDTSINLSALNGESLPKDVKVGDEILSGSINLTSLIQIKATKVFEESTVSKIFELVENASSHKSKMENFITRFAKWYTPFVCYCALALAILPPLYLLLMQQDMMWQTWFIRALTFLVISCPCALVISIPMTFFAGLGSASSKGILIKGSNYLEALSKCDIMVFDKTGTLTKGSFQVDCIHSEYLSEEALLEYVAYGEYHSIHPIAMGIKQSYGKDIDVQRIQRFVDHGGKGIEAIVDDRLLYIGTKAFLAEKNILFDQVETSKAIVYVGIDHQYAGSIGLSDTIKTEAKATMDSLRQLGIKKCMMISGDQKAIAEEVGKKVGMDKVYANCLPSQKVAWLEALLQEYSQNQLAYIGDGVNDAPVIMRADVGIAMGVLGSDAAIEAADVVIMDDHLSKLSIAVKTARKCMRIVYQNVIFAIGIKFLCLILGAFGISNMWMAIFADVGVMVVAVLNALRALI